MLSRLLSHRPRRSYKARTRLSIEGVDLEDRTLLSLVDVLGYRNAQPNTVGQPNTGLNAQETILQPSNVNLTTFGKQFETQVDGQVYAQPLVKTGVNITVGSEPGLHNVIYVATQHDSLYAIDATSGHILWHDSFIDPAHGVTTVAWSDVGSDDIVPEIGITSTPVIDPNTNILYLVAKTKVLQSVGANYVLTLHAINLTNGEEALGGPAVIADTYWSGIDASFYTYVSGPAIPGTGDGAVNGIVNFNALRALQRPALTLYNNQVYVMTASHGDVPPYHGWILGYSTADLSLKTVFNSTPNGMDGGFWMSGAGIAIDPQGSMYVPTGNGTFDTTFDANGLPIHGNYGNTLLKLMVDPTYTRTVNGWGLKVVDFFTPSNQDLLDDIDADFGSSGPMILPDSAGSAAHPHLMTVMGKETRMFLIDRDKMGRFNPVGEQVVQIVPSGLNSSYTSQAFSGSTMYIATRDGLNMAYTISQGVISSPAFTQSLQTFAYPGANPSLSFNGGDYGIEWVLERTSRQLLAYNSTNLVSPIYGSNQAANQRDALSSIVKFTVPVVANGMTYVGTDNSIAGFGLFLNPPTSASFVTKNTTTQGSWNDAYGAQGYNISQDSSANNPRLPYNVTMNVSQASPLVWNPSTLDPRALLKAAPNASDGIAAAWSGASNFSIDVRMNDGLSHQVALYALDWDNQGRNETIQVINDANGAVLNTQTISSFQNGTYLVWNVQGNVTFKVTTNNSASAVISGLFFGDRVPVPGAASFVQKDTSTRGTWKATYGLDGFNVAQDPSTNNPTIPAYAQVAISNHLNFTWAASTSALSALQQTAPNSTNRIAAAWFNDPTFSIDVKLNDGKTHQVALYALDWDSTRSETIQVISDVTGQVLDTQSLTNFQNGVYAVWNISGAVTFKVINTGPYNAVLSGIFFNPPSTPPLITTQPTSATVNAGSTATFTAAASGTPTPSVQWQVSTNSGSSWSNLSGATSGTYTTPPTTGANNGNLYRAVFSSSAGTATTTTATLTVRATSSDTAVFTKLDTSTRGTWKATYGLDGFNVAQDPSTNNPTIPAYAQVTIRNNLNYIWTANTSALSALQQTAPNSTNRIAAAWFNDPTFSIDVKLNDGQTHQVALYALDWDSTRSETIQVVSNVTGQVLDTQSLTNFQNGVYAVWNISGAVTFKVINTGPYNAVLSGIFFNPPSTPPLITTQPTSATVNAGSTATFTAAASGTPTPSVQWQVSTNSGSSWSNLSGATSGTYTTPPTTGANNGNLYRAVFSSSAGTATTTTATLTVRATSSETAVFTKLDTTTQGTWKPVYGSEGYNVSQDPSTNNPLAPSYATVSFSNAINAMWNPATTDGRALQKAAVNSDSHIAATWFNESSFSIKVQANDTNVHQVALYALDFDNVGRSETVQVISNTTGAVLDTRSISSFQNGVYLVWNFSGSVTFKVINTGPFNAVISGLFFGAGSSTAASASFVTQDASTQGTWKSVYGTSGWDVSQDLSPNNPSLPSYAALSVSNATNFVWAASTSDVRALQKASPSASDRIAACWSSEGSFALNLALNDGQSHTMALYALDWDNAGRTETIQVIDTATQAVLDTRSLASFQNGVYLVWSLTGNVTFSILNTGPGNAVISGIFWG